MFQLQWRPYVNYVFVLKMKRLWFLHKSCKSEQHFWS